MGDNGRGSKMWETYIPDLRFRADSHRRPARTGEAGRLSWIL